MGTITATTADMALALGTVMHAASRDAARPVLHGVYLQPGRLGVRAVAADNYRLAVRDFAGTADAPLILDLDDAATLHKALKAERVSSDVTLSWSEDNPVRVAATWANGFRSTTLRAIDGTFPHYAQVIPPDDRAGDHTLGLTPTLVADSMKALATGRNPVVRVTVNEDPRAPIIMRGDPDSFVVLMPVRLPA